MFKRNLREELYGIIEEIDNSIARDKIEKSKNLISDLGFDSIKMITLVVSVEHFFDIELDDDELDINKISTLELLLNIIEKKCELREK